jgi:phospholipase A-2-activating protein
MNQEVDTYNISESIYHHKNILRTISCNGLGIVVSGAFDKTCAYFTRSEETGSYIHLKDTSYHEDYVYIVRSDIKDRGFFTGSKDKKVIFMDNEGTPMGEFIGHLNTVNDISQAEPNTFISGSWDATAKIWDINTQKCLYTLKDHSYAVSTLALENKKYITGSQDKKLKFWDQDKLVRTIDDAHDDIIRSIILSPDGNTFYSTSNDCVIKQWTFGGELIAELKGHDGFIFR